MFSFISKYRVLLFTGIGTWLIYVAHNFSVAYRLQANPELVLLHEGLNDLTLFVFYLANILMVRQIAHNQKGRNPADMLWNVVLTGITGAVSIRIAMFFTAPYEGTPFELFTHPFLDALRMYVFVLFLFAAIYTFKRFIFFINSKQKNYLWQTFEFLMVLGLLMVFENPFYFISEWIKMLLLILTLILILYFCTYIRWVGYLSFTQKLNTIGMLLLNIVMITAFSYVEDLFSYSISSLIHEFFFYKYFLIGQAALFILIYSAFSILVLIFNLPTSSVYEQTRTDLESIQKIHKSILPGQAKEGSLRTLLEAIMLSSGAQHGWVELEGESTPGIISGIEVSEIEDLQQNINLRKYVLDTHKPYQIQDINRFFRLNRWDRRFRSMLILPIQTRFADLGAVFIVRDIPNGFNEDNIEVLQSFANQAALALENLTLTEKSIEIERFQEQLAIARQMQEKLYPKAFPTCIDLDIYAHNKQSEAVGGDYYDILNTHDGIYKVVVGDVSGKGTTAAFYMAEVKGMFQALARTNLAPDTVIINMNEGLAQCMDKGSFLTLTCMEINMNTNMARIVRAGHCPTLYYSALQQEWIWLNQGGIALGVIRNDSFPNYVVMEDVPLHPGDQFVLFTDGIVEARNDAGDEFGYERLKNILKEYIHASAAEDGKSIIKHIESFSGGYIEDDYTLMLIRINGKETIDTHSRI